MAIVRIAPASTDHAGTRDAFARAAYDGALPRASWRAAQELVARYDDATDEATRAAIAMRMDTFDDGDDGRGAEPSIAA